MEKNLVNCANAAVITWQRMGAKGRWGVREGKPVRGGRSGVLEICKEESDEWWNWKMIEEINSRWNAMQRRSIAGNEEILPHE